MSSKSPRRVVITGLGVISPLGLSADALWDALSNSRSGIAPITSMPTEKLPIHSGAEAREFTGDIEQFGPMDKAIQRAIRKGQKLMCREIEMGVAAAQLALSDANLTADKRDTHRTGVIYGSDYIMTMPEEFNEGIRRCTGEDGKFRFDNWAEQGLPQVNPLWLLKYLPNMPASHIAIYNDLQGPNNSLTLREASSCAALSEAFCTITRGHADAIVVGATGSRIHPFRTLHALTQEVLATERTDPTTMSRPFDADRDGAVVGEGAAALILEEAEHAQAAARRSMAKSRDLEAPQSVPSMDLTFNVVRLNLWPNKLCAMLRRARSVTFMRMASRHLMAICTKRKGSPMCLALPINNHPRWLPRVILETSVPQVAWSNSSPV